MKEIYFLQHEFLVIQNLAMTMLEFNENDMYCAKLFIMRNYAYGAEKQYVNSKQLQQR